MTTDRHNVIVERLSDYALGGLSVDERREVERHLRECEACERELGELGLVFQGLARATDPATPPPGLRARVLSRLAREPQDRAAPRLIATQTSGRRTWHPAWLAAAAAIVLALAGALYLSNERTRRVDSELARLSAELRDFQQRLSENATQADMALSILTAADMRRIDLSGAATQPSVGRAYWSPTRGLLVAADRLPPPPQGRVYQVWLIGGGPPVSAGILGTAAGGRGMLIVPAPGGISAGPVTVAITDEPPGGLRSPTGGKHLVGSL
jgi:anti-sigma-K factor RskA